MTDTLHWKLSNDGAQTRQSRGPRSKIDSRHLDPRESMTPTAAAALLHISIQLPVNIGSRRSAGLLKLLQINRSGNCHSCINDWVTQPLWIKDSMQLNFSSFIKWRDSIKVSDRHNNVGSQFQRRRSKVKVIAKKLSYILQSSMFHNSPSQTAPKSQWIGPSSQKLPLNLPHPSVWRGWGWAVELRTTVLSTWAYCWRDPILQTEISSWSHWIKPPLLNNERLYRILVQV